MNDWLLMLDTLSAENQNCVLVTVAYTAGSAPREAGAKMVVTADAVYGTIGGGNLEHNAVQSARAFMLDKARSQKAAFLDLYALGPMLEQCCGGVVFLHYEQTGKKHRAWIKVLKELDDRSMDAIVVTRTAKEKPALNAADKLIVTEFETSGTIGELDEYATVRARELLRGTTTSQTCLESLSESGGSLPDIADVLLFDVIRPCHFHIALFGAGHVGKAVVATLEQVAACSITWVDSRRSVFPESLPSRVIARHAIMPTAIVPEIPPDSFYLVMTHSHRLDQALCEAVLNRNDFRYLGLIGSETKRKRFCKRLREAGIAEKQLKKLSCPIGISGIESKEPGSIAISVVAQLLQVHDLSNSEQHKVLADKKIHSI